MSVVHAKKLTTIGHQRHRNVICMAIDLVKLLMGKTRSQTCGLGYNLSRKLTLHKRVLESDTLTSELQKSVTRTVGLEK